jgi:hypothetical protein
VSSRAKQLQRAWRAVFVVCGAATVACNSARDTPVNPVVGSDAANVGLYTPGSTLGAMMETSSSADAGQAMMVVEPTGDRCMGSSGMPGTPCMMMVTFKSVPIGEHWKPKNIGAVWIEDSNNVYIKTIERWAKDRARDLYHWLDHACSTAWPEMDAVSMATFLDHNSLHSSTWDGRDFKGMLVPDGTYHLYVEVTETETNFGPLNMVSFEKGPTAFTMMYPDSPSFTGLTISYMPSAGGSDNGAGKGAADAGKGASDAGKAMDASQAADGSILGDAGGTILGATGGASTSGGEPPTGGLDAGPASGP